ncbi:peptidase [Synechococcus phage S-MbCM6]|uniref:Peptidase n=1 Tax=Synechococcus phage S-MbCM6 TaxID=3126011 RepID=H8ZMN9_9CAUD|nr:peptidase [Synechococcus phage ACG-2014c]AFD02750.1 peptidase [Synechococcus phage ACG-2014c]
MSKRREDMTVNTEVKGNLARLLATENLKVEHRRVSTACFDVSNRVLILPIWKTASNTVYDLLVGHEVGHALYTPSVDFGNAPKDFVNVLEDARIEKMMKRTYPGLRRSFFDGYRELWQDDFFGVKDSDPSDLPLIDRINLYFKGNPNMPFSDEEMVWVTRASNTNTFDEVITLAEELYEYAKELQEKKVEAQIQSQSGDNNTGDQEEYNYDSEFDQGESAGEGDSDGDRKDSDLDTPSYEGGSSFDETLSMTDSALQEALETLIDDDAKEWIYLDLPKVNLQNYVVTWKTIQSKFNEFFHERDFNTSQDAEYYQNALNFTYSKCEEYKKSAQKSVNYLVKQFEMKKSADQYARAATSRTGVLDTNKLHTYRYNEDIFKKVTVIPDGKNQGLMLLIDWSGSMANVLIDTLKQTYNLIWFCRKVGIAFRVYAFQSGYMSIRCECDTGAGDDHTLHIGEDFRLLEFISSRMNAKQLDTQMKNVWAQAWDQNNYTGHRSLTEYSLGGTPLGEATMCMREAVKQLKSIDRVEKVNVISLTDGEANPLGFVTTFPEGSYREGDMRKEYLCHNRNKIFILRDPVTGYSRRLNTWPYDTTKEIVSFYKEITDYNWIGIRLCSKSDMTRCLNHFGVDIEKYSKQWAKEKFVEVGDESGFTKQFYMPNQYIGVGTDDLEVKQKKEVVTKAELTRAFKKHMKSKMTNKTILNAFIEQIA